VGEDSILSVKMKEFVVIGVLASRGLQYGVEAHMRRAIDYGATKEELFEVIKAAAVPGGGVVYSVGVRALQPLEQEGAVPPTSPPRTSTRRQGKGTPSVRIPVECDSGSLLVIYHSGISWHPARFYCIHLHTHM
jgi:Carboxymuconolactone decarboxylase family